MFRNFTKMIFGLALIMISIGAYAQTTVSGNITDSDGAPLIGVNVLVDGTVLGTITDINGDFTLTVQSAPPFTLVISYVGYETQRIEVSSATSINVQLEESTLLGQEVVVSASRVEESTLKSPVSVERMDILDIQNTAATDFYSALRNMNGVDFSTQSLTFKSVNARGFGANGNNRFVQLIDGIDNQAPGLNFPVGNIVGINDLDLESAELIPGASSALYGPNALQGILILKSKSPFEYQGLDFYTKMGVNHIDEEDHDMSLYRDMGIRYAKAINNKFAFKLTASWVSAEDFIGVDYRDQGTDIIERSPNVDTSDPNYRADQSLRTYNGVNVYGDFGFSFNTGLALGLIPQSAASLLPTDQRGSFSPTGFRERDIVNNQTESIKAGAALHYRINDNLEVIGQYNYGLGSTVYTANDRYVLDNFNIWTAKLELRGSNFFIRGYTTQEDAGDSYPADVMASIINQNNYLGDYIGGFISARTLGQTVDASHVAARAYADNAMFNGLNTGLDDDPTTPFVNEGRPAYAPGTEEFARLENELRNTPISQGGAQFLDKSSMNHYEGSYNLNELVDFADIVVGGNFRTYNLNSEGTLFVLDNGEEISYNEYGGYIQVKKDIIPTVSITASGRYDKNEFFDGQFSPRIAGVWEFLDNNNFRASYQTGFRIPTTQDQFITLNVPGRRLIGFNEIVDREFNINTNTVYTVESVAAAQASGNVSDLVVASDVYDNYELEQVSTREIGYKGLLLGGSLLIDAYYYQSTYTNFGAEITVVQAVESGDIRAVPSGYTTGEGERHADAQLAAFLTGGDAGAGVALQNYGVDVNVDEEVDTRGFGLTAEYTIGNGYVIKGNVSNDKQKSLSLSEAKRLNASFNTPEWRFNIGVSNRKLTDRIGFAVTGRWQDEYFWSSAIGDGIIPSFWSVDAQVTYSLPSIGGRLKIGGSNITNERYTTSLANPRLGAIYYVQLNLENILNQF